MASYIFLFLKMCQKPLCNTYKREQHQPIFSPYSRGTVFSYSLVEPIQAKSDNYSPREIRFLNFVNLFTVNFYQIKTYLSNTLSEIVSDTNEYISLFIDYEAPTYAQE